MLVDDGIRLLKVTRWVARDGRNWDGRKGMEERRSNAQASELVDRLMQVEILV